MRRMTCVEDLPSEDQSCWTDNTISTSFICSSTSSLTEIPLNGCFTNLVNHSSSFPGLSHKKDLLQIGKYLAMTANKHALVLSMNDIKKYFMNLDSF